MAKEVKQSQELSGKTQKVLLNEARSLGYPAALAKSNSNKSDLIQMIEAGKYPNDKFKEDIQSETTEPTEPEEPKITEPTEETETEQESEPEKAEDSNPEDLPTDDQNPKFDYDVTIPADARIVFGGPVLKNKVLPFGFTVTKALTEEEACKYGAGKGVLLHSKQSTLEGEFYTYKIVYK